MTNAKAIKAQHPKKVGVAIKRSPSLFLKKVK
jgi:hypothetical protein